MPCAPARSASLACSMLCAVLLVPAPVITVARSPTASTTARTSSAFSASVVVGPSPVVPLTTRPSLPSSTRCSASSCARFRSSAPSASKGVAIAVSTRPNGRPGAAVGGLDMPKTVPLDTLHARDDLVTPGEVRRISRDRPFAPELLLDLGHNRRCEGGAVDLGEHAVDLADGVGVPAFLGRRVVPFRLRGHQCAVGELGALVRGH